MPGGDSGVGQDRLLEARPDLGRVSGEDLRDARTVIEPDERLGDHESALGERRPLLGERNRRLEHRGMVVCEVADDGRVQPLRLLEVDQPGARADERVATEPASLDRLQEEASAGSSTESEVRAERSDEIGVDGASRGHGRRVSRRSARGA